MIEIRNNGKVYRISAKFLRSNNGYDKIHLKIELDGEEKLHLDIAEIMIEKCKPSQKIFVTDIGYLSKPLQSALESLVSAIHLEA